MNAMARRKTYGPLVTALVGVLVLVLSACGDAGPDEGDAGANGGDATEPAAPTEAAEETQTDTDGGETAAGDQCGDDLVAAAESEGEAVWYTSIPTEASEAVAAAFSEKYPAISAQVVRSPSFELWERFRTESSAGDSRADLFNPSDFGIMEMAKDEELLAQYVPDSIEGSVDDRFIDPEGYFWSNRLLTTSIMYNTDLVPEDQAPATWQDLLDPYWTSENLGIGDPRESAAIYGAFHEMANSPEIGEEFFQALADKDPILYAQGGQQRNAVVSGEIEATIAVDYRAWQLIADGAPVAIVYPDEGVGYTLDYHAVVADAPHPCAARLLMEYIGSQEGAVVLARNLGVYVTQDLPDGTYPAGDERPPLSEVPLLDADFNQMAEDFESFNDQFDEWFGR